MINYDYTDKFINRHIGPNELETKEMLKEIGVESVENLINNTVPEKIRLEKELNLPQELSEYEFLDYIKKVASENIIAKSYIGMGYYPTIVPPPIQRNIFENPGWYTQYTPYQAEISQGRLEVLLAFQTMISDLTSLSVANASLLDEATASAEAMMMFYSSSRNSKKNCFKFFVDVNVYPQTIDVLKTRANPHGIEVVVGEYKNIDLDDTYFGILVQNPNSDGELNDYSELCSRAKLKGIFTVIASDIMSLALIKSPGEMGADAAVGSTQRFGVPMGFGGPHAAYFATKDEFKRVIPGRIIGVSIDSNGNRALRMALQTREQHIRREKATSNICTSQVLLAIMAAMYAVYHGKDGIKNIAKRINNLTILLDSYIVSSGYKQENKYYFDTLKVEVTNEELVQIKNNAKLKSLNFNYFDYKELETNSFTKKYVGIALNEVTSYNDVIEIAEIFALAKNRVLVKTEEQNLYSLPVELQRTTDYLTNEVFVNYHSETELLRYIKRLENKDLSLTLSMIPLGSCTMKLNAASEMLCLTLPELTNIHPFAPKEQTIGYHKIIENLSSLLCEITGFSAVSFEPNSGAQGEYTGLMVIRQYHNDRNQGNRNIALIPSSAHGTNPASAVLSGMKVVVVACDEKGNIDLTDLKKKASEYANDLSCLMVTYPSTHGVFEEDIMEICEIIHEAGGQVYMDGANMNAQVGLTSPKTIGADVCHLNLHKTFAIPHGGGGPGMGPICVAEHLAKYLPNHTVVKVGGEKGITAVSASPYGSANILIISLGYILMSGKDGLKKATEYAIFNANYLKARLKPYYKVLYTGKNDTVAHELIFDMREFKHTINLEVEDIAKRLMDYGFHAPTVSFPVAGTLMVEPTESESKFELDRFCNAMISIRNEIKEIEDAVYEQNNNVLKNAPHTFEVVCANEWKYPYPREKAAFPCEYVKKNKFWPSVGRVNNAFGDRNLVCNCS